MRDWTACFLEVCGECSSILFNYGIELPNEVKDELNTMIDGLGQSIYEKGYMIYLNIHFQLNRMAMSL